MEFIKRRFSFSSDPDKDTEENEGSNSSRLLNNLNSTKNSIWNGINRIKSDRMSATKSDRTSPSGSDEPLNPSSNVSEKAVPPSFLDSVKARLSKVRIYENGDTDSDEENDKKRQPPGDQVETLIDTAENSHEEISDEEPNSTVAEPETNSPSETKHTNDGAASTRRKRLNKRQDSFTGADIYIERVASRVKAGLMDADTNTVVVSPDKAVNEFKFKDESNSSPGKSSNGLAVPGNLINFDSVQNLADAARDAVDPIVHHEDDLNFEYESSSVGGLFSRSPSSNSNNVCDDSSEPVYTEDVINRSDSLNSFISADFVDDEDTKMAAFASQFVHNIFSQEISNTTADKATFGKYVRDGNFRLQFARCISEKRAVKVVSEHTFYQLVQYFAVILFECDEADDFTPVLILMNMCFTFYYLSSRSGKIEHNYLSTYLKNQPIWQSMRYWSASFYEAVQNERVQKALPTNRDTPEDERNDRQFQENVIFSKLGAFLYKMNEFGLKDEWCYEFLRKQATIGNLSQEQIEMLRETIKINSRGSEGMASPNE